MVTLVDTAANDAGNPQLANLAKTHGESATSHHPSLPNPPRFLLN